MFVPHQKTNCILWLPYTCYFLDIKQSLSSFFAQLSGSIAVFLKIFNGPLCIIGITSSVSSKIWASAKLPKPAWVSANLP